MIIERDLIAEIKVVLDFDCITWDVTDQSMKLQGGVTKINYSLLGSLLRLYGSG
jgi:hypothetical protein